MKEFLGYHRPNGSVGIRNHVLILSTSGLSNPLTRRLSLSLKGTIPIFTPNGRGQVGKDRKQLERTLIGLAGNPNVAATLIVSYDSQTADYFKDKIRVFGKPVYSLSILKERGVINAAAIGTRKLMEMVVEASKIKRKPASISKITIGLECGGSDVSSGKVSNPSVGDFSDMLVKVGGTSIFSETVELIGTEKILAKRAVNDNIAREIITTINEAFSDASERGANVKAVNPVPENIEGGLETLEQKALGALMKTGNEKIAGVLKYAEVPKKPGLYFMDTPFFSTESMTAMVAAGAQLILFTTGVGNNIASSISPTLKVTGNPNTGSIMAEHVDIDLSTTSIASDKSEDRLRELTNFVIEICDGALTKAEVLDETDMSVSRIEPSV